MRRRRHGYLFRGRDQFAARRFEPGQVELVIRLRPNREYFHTRIALATPFST
ncbi:hypothetical protein [Nonomuraea jabiensis]|uniref:Uncharacterized protein n=1 Tax=Nonomuraea jabiensis TaxID=882448 RepID=A0A7W9GC54_9ACTN|nr:hypothetical protein [Nonomuraea jabiensis]MBB5781069.1 hypothetical protein [Nonomuraea jabiensis]